MAPNKAVEQTPKRGPGRPRQKPITEPNKEPPIEPPASSDLIVTPNPAIFPLLLEEARLIRERQEREDNNNVDIETTDRAGAAQMIGASVSVVLQLEKDDPDWPAGFKVGRQNIRYLKRKVREWINKKAAAAEQSKRNHGDK